MTAYTLDVFLPVVDLGQDKAWVWVDTPRVAAHALSLGEDGFLCSKRLDSRFAFVTCAFRNHFHRAVYWTLVLAGWVLISLFIAGVSGLMKKE